MRPWKEIKTWPTLQTYVYAPLLFRPYKLQQPQGKQIKQKEHNKTTEWNLIVVVRSSGTETELIHSL
jgi:hypothetical protein